MKASAVPSRMCQPRRENTAAGTCVANIGSSPIQAERQMLVLDPLPRVLRGRWRAGKCLRRNAKYLHAISIATLFFSLHSVRHSVLRSTNYKTYLNKGLLRFQGICQLQASCKGARYAERDVQAAHGLWA